MDATVSVSKGVFVFKNGTHIGSTINKKVKRKKKLENSVNSNIFENELWYKSYTKLWKNVETKLQDLNDAMFATVLSNLINFLKICYNKPLNEIPAAVLLTGINMPDHMAQFNSLSKKIEEDVTPHVVCLQSQNSQNLKAFIENMVYQFVNKNETDFEDDSDSEDQKVNNIKKSQCNMALLQSWFESLYSNKKHFKNLVIIIQDFEGFNEEVLQNFILIASSYVNILPFIIVFGVATSLSVLHKSLPYKVSSKVNIQVFTSQSSSVYLNNILEHVFFGNCPFHLGGKVFTLYTDIFLFYDLSVTGFIHNIKYAMLEHYSYGNAMSLCVNREEIDKILNKFTHEDCENTRQLLSFRKMVESESFKNRIKLLTDDDYFINAFHKQLIYLHNYIYSFHLFIKCLHILVNDLPKSPLGKQIREIYNIATTKDIVKSSEYKEAFQLLNFLSKNEFVTKIEKLNTILEKEINNVPDSKNIEKYANDIKRLLLVLNDDCMDDVNDVEMTQEEGLEVGHLNRIQLKEKLLTMSKQSKPLNKYEKNRKTLLDYLSGIFAEHLYEPTQNYFHEIFFFNDMSVQNQIVGTHRAAIHTALNDPHNYLQCSCCEIPNDTIILRSMPDICIVYKLHLEYGKMINLFDWLQAFLSIVDPVQADDEDNDKREVNPELQARFTQAVAELEYLGFIKSSKRKTDHVSRLTWGG